MEFLTGILPYTQVALGLLLVVGILIQQSDASLGAVFGGGNDAGGVKRTRRGPEQTLFNGTVAISIAFVLSVLLGLLI